MLSTMCGTQDTLAIVLLLREGWGLTVTLSSSFGTLSERAHGDAPRQMPWCALLMAHPSGGRGDLMRPKIGAQGGHRGQNKDRAYLGAFGLTAKAPVG